MMRRLVWSLAGAVLATPVLGAQEPQPRRQEPIEIRGSVPTPQVVTVRPREMPAYSRKVLVPNFYDHDFWPSILPAYRLVAERLISRQAPVDTALSADTLGAARRTAPDSLAVPPDTLSQRDTLMQRDTLGRPVPPPPAYDERTVSHGLSGPGAAGTASASSTLRERTLTSIRRRL